MRSFVLAFLTLASIGHASPHRYDHVVIVIEENTDYAQVLGNRVDAPFINELADGGVNFTEFYAITHPSQPNYIHLFSGDHQSVVDDAKPTTYPWTTPNLGAALIAAGATFAGYSEDLPAIGDRDTTGVDVVIGTTTYKLYRRKHNPWANWQAAIGDLIEQNQLPPETNLRFLDFPTDFSQLPDVSFVVPNEQNDMHDGTIRMGDDWLRANLAAYVKWARTHNSLLIVTFDEDDFSGPNKIPTVFHGAG
ncbi:MAG: alkaline phosphatase family protein, partial [Chthoniobacteraceae bacterium]